MNPVPELNDGHLYDLLEATGEQARLSVRVLARSKEEGTLDPGLLAGPAQQGAALTDKIRAHLLQAVVVSLPKEEVEALSRALAGIPAAALRCAERFELARGKLGSFEFEPLLGWVEELVEIVLDMVRQLRGFESLDRIKDLHPRLETIADRAETLIEALVNQAYRTGASPVDSLMVKDLGERFQSLVDFCRDAGATMSRISFAFL